MKSLQNQKEKKETKKKEPRSLKIIRSLNST